MLLSLISFVKDFWNWLGFVLSRPGDFVYIKPEVARPHELRGMTVVALNHSQGNATLKDHTGEMVVVHRSILVL
jgi:hypothetical protein